jgi:hypothetical protein
MMKRSVDWHSLPRQSRLAGVMYPHLSDGETQRDIAELAMNEGKKSPLQARMEQEKPKQQRSKW